MRNFGANCDFGKRNLNADLLKARIAVMDDRLKGNLYTARAQILEGDPITGDAKATLLEILAPILGPIPARYAPPVSDVVTAPKTTTSTVIAQSAPPALPRQDDVRHALDPSNWVSKEGFRVIGCPIRPENFATYVNALPFATWIPRGIVVHNTSAPTLAQRPLGFMQSHMNNLRDYYAGLKWSSGPHLFIDDKNIWLFSPLTSRGTHSPSFNATHIGIEMLGEYSSEDPWSGRGLGVLRNTKAAILALGARFNWTTQEILFHKQDPKTTHKDCPGKLIDKNKFLDFLSNP